MDLDEIKRGLRAEIKNRENEQYFTFQCNVRQMCKDVLAKLEEQESLIAALKEKYNELAKLHDKAIQACCDADKVIRHHKYKRCLDNAGICCEKKENCYNRALRKYSKDEADYLVRKSDFWQDWEFRWLNIAEKFREAK